MGLSKFAASMGNNKRNTVEKPMPKKKVEEKITEETKVESKEIKVETVEVIPAPEQEFMPTPVEEIKQEAVKTEEPVLAEVMQEPEKRKVGRPKKAPELKSKRKPNMIYFDVDVERRVDAYCKAKKIKKSDLINKLLKDLVDSERIM